MSVDHTAALRASVSGRMTGAQWRTIVLASLGGALEFYDFIIYGIFAPSIAAAFFPGADARVSLILSFSVFAGGYLARPFGGMLLGALGDRFGRRGVFLFSLTAISASTVAMGATARLCVVGLRRDRSHGGAAFASGPLSRRGSCPAPSSMWSRRRLSGRASPVGSCSSVSTRA